MKTYNFSFVGRQSGAIGVFYRILDTYKALDIHGALSLLYEDYDISHDLNITDSSGKTIDYPAKLKIVPVRSNSTRKRNPKTFLYIKNKHHGNN